MSYDVQEWSIRRYSGDNILDDVPAYQQTMADDSQFNEDDIDALDTMAKFVKPVEEPDFSADDLRALQMLSTAYDSEDIRREEGVVTEASVTVDDVTGEVIEAPCIATIIEPHPCIKSDPISEAAQQPLEDFEEREPFQEKVEQPSDDDEMIGITKRVADVASSLAFTLEKLEENIPQADIGQQNKEKKKEKHVTINEEEEIINDSLGNVYDEEEEEISDEVEDRFGFMTDEDGQNRMRAFEASVGKLFDFEQPIEPEIEDLELAYSPELSDEEMIRHSPVKLEESEPLILIHSQDSDAYSPDVDADQLVPSPRPPSSGSEAEEARPIKAEIKLLVKTTEPGKEAVEIRSIREFVEADDRSKGHFSRIVKSPTPSSEEAQRGPFDGAEQSHPVIGEGQSFSSTTSHFPELIIGTPEGESYFKELKKVQEAPGSLEILAVDVQDLTSESNLLVKVANDDSSLSQSRKSEQEELESWDLICSEEEVRLYQPFAEDLADQVMISAFNELFLSEITEETYEEEENLQKDCGPPQWHLECSQSGIEEIENSKDKFESLQYTTPEGASVHTTQYTTPDGTTVTTTHTRVVSSDVSSSDSEQISEQPK